jgi:pilus assembly protein CpaB
MWKVKRMNTARIVGLTIAPGVGGIAAILAGGSDNKIAAPAGPAALHAVGIRIAISDFGPGQSVKPEDLQSRAWSATTANSNSISLSCESVGVVRHGAASPQSIEKWSKGRTI